MRPQHQRQLHQRLAAFCVAVFFMLLHFGVASAQGTAPVALADAVGAPVSASATFNANANANANAATIANAPAPAPATTPTTPTAATAVTPPRLLQFTAEEQAWLAANPVVRFGVSPGMAPYQDADAIDGAAAAGSAPAVPPHGYVIELLQLLAERTGLRFEFRRLATYAASIDALQRAEVDALPLAAPDAAQPTVRGTQPPSRYLSTRPLLVANMALSVRRDIADVSPANDFGGYRVAVDTGSPADLLVQARFPKMTPLRFDTPEAALRAVASGNADIYIGFRHVAVHYIERNLLANVQIRSAFGPGLTALGPAVRTDLPLLQQILDKALASVTQAEQASLARRWLPEDALRAAPASAVQLTEAERQWVDTNGRIRVGYDAAFAPITLQNDLQQMRGLGADVMRLAASKVGLVIQSESGGSFAEVYRRGTKGEIDVLVGAARAASRRQDFDFVGPFMRVPTAIVTRSASGLAVTKLEELGRRRLALLDDHFLMQPLRVRFPAMVLMTFATQDAVLSAVADGRADAAIGNIKVVNQLIHNLYTGRVQVTGTVPDADSELYFAVRHDLPALSLLLRKGLDAVSESEMSSIERRWLVADAPGWSRDQVLRASVITAAIAALLLTYLYLLRRGNQRLRAARQVERDARRVAEETTAGRGRFVGYLTHELRGTIGAIGAGAQLLKEDLPTERRARLCDAIATSADGFQGLLETALQYESNQDRPVALQPVSTDLATWWGGAVSPFELAAQGKGLRFDAALLGVTRDTPALRFDAQRLRQVVNNLVNNAIKFTPFGSVRVLGRLDAAYRLEIEVIDTGPGLQQEDLDSLFLPYAQGREGQRAHHGAGLGLAISRQLLEAMGGTVSAGAAQGGGARFVMQVPLAAVHAANHG